MDFFKDFQPSLTFPTKGRVHKKNPEKVWSFAKPGGGSRRVVKCQTSILGS